MSNDRVVRVEQACIDLVADGEKITVEAVAARARIGRATIYRHAELNTIVHDHRQRGNDAITLTGLTVQIDQLRQAVEAVATKVRRHEEILRKLGRSTTTKRTR